MHPMGHDPSRRLSFRRAAAGDEEALAKILHDAWHEAYRGMVPKAFLQSFTLARGVDRFRSSLAAGTEQTYLVGQKGAATKGSGDKLNKETD